MNLLTRTAVGAVAAAALLAPAAATFADSAPRAAGKSWTKLETFERAKQQACKVSVDRGHAWRVYNRLDARLVARDRTEATLTATNGDAANDRVWDSGWVRHGQVSDIGSIKVPKRPGWALIMTLHSDNAGTGGELTIDDIGRC